MKRPSEESPAPLESSIPGPVPTSSSEESVPAKGDRSTRAIAWIMDEVISVPGTKLKIGLDPILGVFSAVGIPVGDVTTNAVSCVSLLEALRRGLPFHQLWRMIGNIFLNAGVGAIPILGDLFSFVFRSNSRNRDIIQEFLASPKAQSTKPSWWRVAWSFVLVSMVGFLSFLISFGIWVLIGRQIFAFVLPKLMEWVQ